MGKVGEGVNLPSRQQRCSTAVMVALFGVLKLLLIFLI